MFIKYVTDIVTPQTKAIASNYMSQKKKTKNFADGDTYCFIIFEHHSHINFIVPLISNAMSCKKNPDNKKKENKTFYIPTVNSPSRLTMNNRIFQHPLLFICMYHLKSTAQHPLVDAKYVYLKPRCQLSGTYYGYIHPSYGRNSRGRDMAGR